MNTVWIVVVAAIGIVALLQGVMWSQSTQGFRVDHESTYSVMGLSVNLYSLLTENNLAPSDVPVYLGTAAGIKPAQGLFLAMLNGQKALIIEQQEEPHVPETL